MPEILTDRLRHIDALFAERVLGLKIVTAHRYTRSIDAAWGGVTKHSWFGGVEGPFAENNDYLATVYADRSEAPFVKDAAHPAEALVLACLRAVGCTEAEIEGE
jgi:hypothetical protein